VKDQTDRLKDALANRRRKKQAVLNKIQELKEEEVLMIYQTQDASPERLNAEQVVSKIKDRFEKDEQPQVVEDYLEQKHTDELKELMLSLFKERAD